MHATADEGGNALNPSESEKESTKPETEPAERDPKQPRELTPEEREQLRKKIEEAKKDDPNIYPVF
jgi:hypothetical protein